MGFVIVIIVMFGLMWLLVMRPQRQRQAAHQAMLDAVKEGDEVLTAGGIYGTVEEIDEDGDIWVEIAEGITVRVARRSIGAVVPAGDGDEEEPPAEEEAPAAGENQAPEEPS